MVSARKKKTRVLPLQQRRRLVPTAFAQVAGIMEEYGNRRVFGGLRAEPGRRGVIEYSVIWHRRRLFRLIVDTNKGTMGFPLVLPGMASRSPIYRDFKAFVEAHHDGNLPRHRRIDPAKARVRCANRQGNVSLTITLVDGDYAYATQRLIHLVHETYVLFVTDGQHKEYRTEQFGPDEDD